MFIYMGVTCPYCGQVLTENDDITVCPDCGTPHHRSCYLEHGRCFNEAKHAEGFEWVNRNFEKADREEKKKMMICPVCGEEVDRRSEVCPSCGHRFVPRQPEFSQQAGGYAQQQRVQQISLTDKIEGVPVKDYLVYLGRGSVRHIMAFKRQEDSGRKTGFTLSALVSPLLFFIYYRMWSCAAPMFLVTLLLNFPGFVVLFFGENATTFWGYTMAQWNSVGNICTVILFAIQVLCAFFSVYMLKNSSSKAIKKLRRACDNEEDYNRLLSSKACPSVAFYIIMGISMVSPMASFFML